MKKILMILSVCIVLAFTACHAHPDTAAGDSTGTGSGGARVPGKVASDTTHHDTTKNSLTTGLDSSKHGGDTTKK
jgi:hypothetical protein